MINVLFVSTVFVSSFLLFMVQPMLAKTLLPLVGGSPVVWIVCMLFFQTLLLGGYAYAALSSAYLSARKQIFLHLIVFAIVVAFAMPIATNTSTDNLHASPEIWILQTLLITIGLPYFLLSSNSSLLQRWYFQSGQGTPYFLFAASNIGSLLGLFAYPFLVEWLWTLPTQKIFWSIGFALLTILLGIIALVLNRLPNATSGQQSLGKNLPMSAAAHIVFLGFIPSSLFLSTTLYITTDIASFPLLWIIPLALYLLSFIITFTQRGLSWLRLLQKAHLPVVFLTIMALSLPPYIWVAVLHFIFFFIIATSVHGQAATQKPAPEYLTAFFFWLSVGGALGGLFNTVAPYLFNDVYEHYIVLILSVFALPLSHFAPKFTMQKVEKNSKKWRKNAFGMAAIFSLAALCLTIPNAETLEKEIFHARNFFGISRVLNAPDRTLLRHGTTNHGFQFKTPEEKLRVTSYYTVIHDLLGKLPDSFHTQPIGVIGLGAGTMACAAQPNQPVDFFEINQMMVDIAQNPNYFTYMRDCPSTKKIIMGDGRLQLAQQPDHHYQLLVMDAFTSDAVPFHLITREAIAIYKQKLATDGIIAVHISNRYLELRYVIAQLAYDAGWLPYFIESKASRVNNAKVAARWVMMVPSDSPYKEIFAQNNYDLLPPSEAPLWTDNYSNILPTIQ